jgi:hypothetical protein
MREDHVKRQIMSVALMALTMIFLMAVAPAGGPEIYMSPADTTVFLSVGPDSFVVSVFVNADVTELMGWDITLQFDPARLTLRRVVEGALPLGSGFETFFWWFDPGVPGNTAHVNGAILGNTVDGPGPLFDLVFEQTAVGTTYVELITTEIRTGVNSSIPHSTADGMVIIDDDIATEPATWGSVKEKYR